MSDPPVPPPPPASDVPPPPPPSLTPPPPAPGGMAPPPGYAAYQQTNWGAGLGRVGGLAKWIQILLVVSAVGSVIGIIVAGQIVDQAEEYLRTGDASALDTAAGLNVLSSALTGLPSVAIIVLSLIWMFRIAQNHARLGRTLRWGPGWAIGGWFLPPCLYVIPTLMLQESWKAADPTVAAGSDRWKANSSAPLIWLWFVLYSVVGLVGAFGTFGTDFDKSMSSDRTDQAQFLADRHTALVIQPLTTIIGAVLWFLVVRNLTRRHTQLTGEARAQ